MLPSLNKVVIIIIIIIIIIISIIIILLTCGPLRVFGKLATSSRIEVSFLRNN